MADDVEIPRWANSIQEFAMKMKAALESEQTSLYLHSWIDHVWGISRRDPKIRNTFTDICYSNSKIIQRHFKARTKRVMKTTDDLETYFKKDCHLSRGQRMKYQALDLQISQFGRVPKQIFTFEHPKKKIKSMRNKKHGKLGLEEKLFLLDNMPPDFDHQSSSDLNMNTELKSTSRFEDFDIEKNSKN